MSVGHGSVSDTVITHDNRVGTNLFLAQQFINNLTNFLAKQFVNNLTSWVKAGSRHGKVGFPGSLSITSRQTIGDADHEREHDGQPGGDYTKSTGDSKRKFKIHDSKMVWVLWLQIFIHDFGTAIQHCASNDH